MDIYEEYAKKKSKDMRMVAFSHYTKLHWFDKIVIGLFYKLFRNISSKNISIAYEMGLINSKTMHEMDAILYKLLGK